MDKDIFIVAGEPSGDLHGANLVKNLKIIDPDLHFYGLGGAKMLSAGVKINFNLAELAVVGFIEVLKNLKVFKKLFNDIIYEVGKIKPKAIILVDYPGFNLRLAKTIKEKYPLVKIIYYISPQVWAWNSKRIKLIEKVVDKILVIFKFEEELYKKHNVSVDFAGHPLLDSVKITKERSEFLKIHNLDENKRIIALLPGSRENEIKLNLRIMLKTAGIFSQTNRDYQFIVLKTPELNLSLYQNILNKFKVDAAIIENDTYNGINASDFCLVASGTATLETAIIKKPMFVIYKVKLLTWIIAKLVIKLKFISLANIVAGKKIVPEFLQFRARPEAISREMLSLLSSPSEIEEMMSELSKVKDSLGAKGASEKCAQAINAFLYN